MSAIPGTKPLMSLNGEEINPMGSFEMPFENTGSFSLSGTLNPIKAKEFKEFFDIPLLPRRCEIISGGLFRRRTFSFLADFLDYKNGEVAGNIIGKLEDRTEFTRLFNVLVTAGYALCCFGFIYFNR